MGHEYELDYKHCNKLTTIKFTGLIGIEPQAKKFRASRSRFVTFELDLSSDDQSTGKVILEKFGDYNIETIIEDDNGQSAWLPDKELDSD